jgi:hypothetical protein
MTEIWQTTDDKFHTKPDNKNMIFFDPNVNPKWIQMPDNLGAERVNVLESKRIECLCKKHNTKAHFLENEFFVAYCESDKGFAWYDSKIYKYRLASNNDVKETDSVLKQPTNKNNSNTNNTVTNRTKKIDNIASDTNDDAIKSNVTNNGIVFITDNTKMIKKFKDCVNKNME